MHFFPNCFMHACMHLQSLPQPAPRNADAYLVVELFRRQVYHHCRCHHHLVEDRLHYLVLLVRLSVACDARSLMLRCIAATS